MHPRRSEGVCFFLLPDKEGFFAFTPLTRGGRGGCFYGIFLSRGCLYPLRGFLTAPQQGSHFISVYRFRNPFPCWGGFFNNPASRAFPRICASWLAAPIPYIPLP